MAIQKISENMTGAQVADLLFNNDKELEAGIAKPWTATAWPAQSLVYHVGRLWQSSAVTVAGDVPSVAAVWVDKMGGYIDYLYAIKSRNLYNKDFTIGRGKLLDSNNTFFDTYDFIPVVPAEVLTQSNDKNFLVADYGWFFDAQKVQLSAGFLGTSIVVPANAFFMRLRFTAGSDFSRYQLERGATASAFVPYATPINTQEFTLKGDAIPSDSLRNSLVNLGQIYRGKLNGVSLLTVTSSGYYGFSVVDETDELLKRYGTRESAITTGYKAPNTTPSIGFAQTLTVPFFNGKVKKYVCVSALIKSNDDAAASKSFLQVLGTSAGSNLLATKIELLQTVGAEKTYMITRWLTVVNYLTAVTPSLLFEFSLRDLNTAEYYYKLAAMSVFDSSEYSYTKNALQFLEGGDITKNYALQAAQSYNANPINKLQQRRRLKTWGVYGTSIDQLGSSGKTSGAEFMRKVADFYDVNMVNHAVGGSRISWSPVPAVGFDYVNNAGVSPQDACWSSTAAERMAFLNSVNRREANKNSAEHIGLCYDNSLTPNATAYDVIFISTYGANDPVTMPASVMNICELKMANNVSRYVPNKARLLAAGAVSAADMFDRSTLFGAYNYMIREIRRGNPTQKIVLLGMNNYAWGQYLVDDIIAIVADLWLIPFVNMAQEMGISEMVVSPEGATARQLIGFSDVHPFSPESRQYMADHLIKKLQTYI